jgi:hypothetical protein
MTYRDITFCSGDGCTRFKTCFRALTNEVQDKAEKLGLPISQFVTPKELDCYIPNENDISDGFGNSWTRCKLRNDCGLHVVRPGIADCWCSDSDESRAKYHEAIKALENLTDYLAALEDVCTAEQLRDARKATEKK